MTAKPTYDEVCAAYDKLVLEKERMRAALGSAKVALMNRGYASNEALFKAAEKDIDAALNPST